MGLCKLRKSHLPAKLFSSPGPEINLCHSTPGTNKTAPEPRAACESWKQGKRGRPKWGAGTEINSVAPSSSLIPVGSLAVLDIQVEKIEDQKLYMSCIAQSRDKQTVYAKSSGTNILILRLGRRGKRRANDLVPSWGLAL